MSLACSLEKIYLHVNTFSCFCTRGHSAVIVSRCGGDGDLSARGVITSLGIREVASPSSDFACVLSIIRTDRSIGCALPIDARPHSLSLSLSLSPFPFAMFVTCRL